MDFDSDDCEMSDDDFGSDDRGKLFMEEETKSRFTNYSMSSSVIKRNEGLTLLDDRFEKVNNDVMSDIYDIQRNKRSFSVRCKNALFFKKDN